MPQPDERFQPVPSMTPVHSFYHSPLSVTSKHLGNPPFQFCVQSDFDVLLERNRAEYFDKPSK